MQQPLIKSKFEIYLFYFSIIDLMFLPYVPFVATSFSQILIVGWFLVTKNKIYNFKEFFALKIFIYFVLLGTVVSLFFIPQQFFSEGIEENIKRAVQIIFLLLYYFFFYHISIKYNIRIKKMLLFFLVYVFLWGILYYLNFELFLNVKSIFNPYDSFIGFFNDSDNFYRFSFIWTDPNNITYIVIGVLIYLLINLEIKFHYGIFSFLIVCIINILSMSSGGWLSLFFFGLPALGFWLKKELIKVSVPRIFFLVSLFLFMLFYSSTIKNHIISDETYLISMDRQEANSGDRRFEIWHSLLEDKMDVLPMYLFFGTGIQVYVNNKPFVAHNGHFMIILAYGLLGYLAFMYIVFRKVKTISLIKSLYILPFLLGFTVNVMFGELKLMGIILLLMAQSRVFDNTILNTKTPIQISESNFIKKIV